MSTLYCQRRTFPARCFQYQGQSSIPDWAFEHFKVLDGKLFLQAWNRSLYEPEVNYWYIECLDGLVSCNPIAFKAQYETVPPPKMAPMPQTMLNHIMDE
jgi:hypothetical protein